MKKFTKLVENLENEKVFKVQAEVDMIFKAANEGEVGYLADSQLGSLENQIEFTIIDISEASNEDWDDLTLESVKDFVKTLPNDMLVEEKVKMAYQNEFGNNKPSRTQILEFYHEMRMLGFDGIIVFNTLSTITEI